MAPEPVAVGAGAATASSLSSSSSASASSSAPPPAATSPSTAAPSSSRAAVGVLAVVRASDLAILAQRFDKSAPAEERSRFEAAMAQLLNRSKTSPIYPRWTASVPIEAAASLVDGGAVYALADQRGLCVTVAAVRGCYPERIARALLDELASKLGVVAPDQRVCEAKVGELNSPLKSLLRDAMTSYSDPAKLDKVTDLHNKVDQVKGIMHENVRKILETHASLESLQTKSEDMSVSANQFLKQSSGLRRQVQMRNMRVKVVAGVCVLAVSAYAFSPLFS